MNKDFSNNWRFNEAHNPIIYPIIGLAFSFGAVMLILTGYGKLKAYNNKSHRDFEEERVELKTTGETGDFVLPTDSAP